MPLQLHKLCAGPGMVPLSLQLSTNAKIGVACEDAGAPVEQAEDEEKEVVVGGDVAADVEVGGDAEIPVDDATAGEDNTQKTALDEALDSITVQGFLADEETFVVECHCFDLLLAPLSVA